MWIIISESLICTSSFRISLLSNLSSAIHSLGCFITSSSSHLVNLFHSFLLEYPVVGSNFLESVIHTCLTFHTYCISFLLLRKSENRQWILVRVSAHCRLYCWVTSATKLLYIFFLLRHLPVFSYQMWVGYCIPKFQILPWTFSITYAIFTFSL